MGWEGEFSLPFFHLIQVKDVLLPQSIEGGSWLMGREVCGSGGQARVLAINGSHCNPQSPLQNLLRHRGAVYTDLGVSNSGLDMFRSHAQYTKWVMVSARNDCAI